MNVGATLRGCPLLPTARTRATTQGRPYENMIGENFVTDELYELPDGWTWTTIGEACAVNPTMQWPEGFAKNKLVHFVPMSAVDGGLGAIVSPEPRPISEVWKGYKRFQDGDVIFARITPCMENGKAAIAKNLLNGIGLGSTEYHVLRPSEKILAEWIYHFIRQQIFRNDAARAMTGTAGQLRVPADFIAQSAIPLPPLPEQRRIVARIESLFAESRTARDALERVPALLKHFRQSVLASAFRGELTERDHVGATLGGRPMRGRPEPRGNGQPHRVAPTETADDLPELPAGWVWTTVEAITKNFDGRRVPVKESNRKNLQGKYPYYGASGIIDHVNDYLFDGTFLLVGEDGANLLSRSTPIAFQASGKFWVNNHAHVLQTVDEIPLAYLQHYFNRIDLSQYVTGTAQPKLTQAHMNSIPVPLAPLVEQRCIVAKIESLFAQADAIERAVAIAQHRADKIDQSILARAFRGELT